jgi:hypothetical protein
MRGIVGEGEDFAFVLIGIGVVLRCRCIGHALRGALRWGRRRPAAGRCRAPSPCRGGRLTRRSLFWCINLYTRTGSRIPIKISNLSCEQGGSGLPRPCSVPKPWYAACDEVLGRSSSFREVG